MLCVRFCALRTRGVWTGLFTLTLCGLMACTRAADAAKDYNIDSAYPGTWWKRMY